MSAKVLLSYLSSFAFFTPRFAFYPLLFVSTRLTVVDAAREISGEPLVFHSSSKKSQQYHAKKHGVVTWGEICSNRSKNRTKEDKSVEHDDGHFSVSSELEETNSTDDTDSSYDEDAESTRKQHTGKGKIMHHSYTHHPSPTLSELQVEVQQLEKTVTMTHGDALIDQEKETIYATERGNASKKNEGSLNLPQNGIISNIQGRSVPPLSDSLPLVFRQILSKCPFRILDTTISVARAKRELLGLRVVDQGKKETKQIKNASKNSILVSRSFLRFDTPNNFIISMLPLLLLIRVLHVLKLRCETKGDGRVNIDTENAELCSYSMLPPISQCGCSSSFSIAFSNACSFACALYEIALGVFPKHSLLISHYCVFLNSFLPERAILYLRKTQEDKLNMPIDIQTIVYSVHELHKLSQIRSKSVGFTKYGKTLRKLRNRVSLGVSQLKNMWEIFLDASIEREQVKLNRKNRAKPAPSKILGDMNPRSADSMNPVPYLPTMMSSLSYSGRKRVKNSLFLDPSGLLLDGESNVNAVKISKFGSNSRSVKDEITEVISSSFKSSTPSKEVSAVILIRRDLRRKVKSLMYDLAQTMEYLDDTFNLLLRKATPGLLRGYGQYIMCICGDIDGAHRYFSRSLTLDQEKDKVANVTPRLSIPAFWKELMGSSGQNVEEYVVRECSSICNGEIDFKHSSLIRRLEHAFGTKRLNYSLWCSAFVFGSISLFVGIFFGTTADVVQTMYDISHQLSMTFMLMEITSVNLHSVLFRRDLIYNSMIAAISLTSTQGVYRDYSIEETATRELMASLGSIYRGIQSFSDTTEYSYQVSLVQLVGVRPARKKFYFSPLGRNVFFSPSLDLYICSYLGEDVIPSIDWTPTDLEQLSGFLDSPCVSTNSSLAVLVNSCLLDVIDYFSSPDNMLLGYFDQFNNDFPDQEFLLNLTQPLSGDIVFQTHLKNLNDSIMPAMKDVLFERSLYVSESISVVIVSFIFFVVLSIVLLILFYVRCVFKPITGYFQRIELYMSLLFNLPSETALQIYRSIGQRARAVDLKGTGSNLFFDPNRRSSLSERSDFEVTGSVMSSIHTVTSMTHSLSISTVDGMDRCAPSDMNESDDLTDIASDKPNHLISIESPISIRQDYAAHSISSNRTNHNSGSIVVDSTRSPSKASEQMGSMRLIGSNHDVSGSSDYAAHSISSNRTNHNSGSIVVDSTRSPSKASEQMGSMRLIGSNHDVSGSSGQLAPDHPSTTSSRSLLYSTSSSTVDVTAISQKEALTTVLSNGAPISSLLVDPFSDDSDDPVKKKKKKKKKKTKPEKHLEDDMSSKSLKNESYNGGSPYMESVLGSSRQKSLPMPHILPSYESQYSVSSHFSSPVTPLTSKASKQVSRSPILDQVLLQPSTSSVSFEFGSPVVENVDVAQMRDESTHESTAFAKPSSVSTIFEPIKDDQMERTVDLSQKDDQNAMGQAIRGIDEPSAPVSIVSNSSRICRVDFSSISSSCESSSFNLLKQEQNLSSFLKVLFKRFNGASLWIFIIYLVALIVIGIIGLFYLLQLKDISYDFHLTDQTKVLVVEIYDYASRLTACEIGQLSRYHSELCRKREVKHLRASIDVFREEYFRFSIGDENVGSVADRFPAINDWLYQPQCLSLLYSNCEESEQLVMNDLVEEYLYYAELVLEKDDVLPDYEGFQYLNGTNRLALTSGFYYLHDIIQEEIESKSSYFYAVKIIFLCIVLIFPISFIIVTKHEKVKECLAQRNLLFTTWSMLPLDSAPILVKEGKDILILLLFMKYLNIRRLQNFESDF
ncbi:hypothetical protein ADUPG1_014216 [Aduncisulcus paluster]|uniref:Uncharacterized protein n=1 Tax=Aduncisulcus paluster TaxID=2918883 RepID=A0ABQ5KB70_9EUKA|nr:hypothetical protein ADUPG1_014216 [Aduncisulcus paluster]